MRQEFDPVTQQLVQSMINHVNRSTGVIASGKLPISVQHTSFYVYCSPNERRQCHENLKGLQAAGLLKCHWHPRVLEEFETLKQIDIPSGKRLLEELGVRSRAEIVAYANSTLRNLRCGVDWIDYKIKEISERWRAGAKYLLLGPEHIEEVVIGFTVAKKIASEPIAGRCLEALSIDWFGSPNTIAENARVIALICQSQLHSKVIELDAKDQLASIGICENSPLIQVHGAVHLNCTNGTSIDASSHPIVAMAVESVESLGLREGRPLDYVLTMEDPVCYQRYVHQVQDNGLVLYVGAFPTKKFLGLYKALVDQLGADVPLFHWGDIDLGGFRSLLSLQNKIKNREIKPFQMGAENLRSPSAEARPLQVQKLRKIAYGCEGAVRQVLAELLELPEERRLESSQRRMPIQAPLCALDLSAKLDARQA